MKFCGKREQAPRSAKLLDIYNLFKSFILKANSETARKLAYLMDFPIKDFPDDRLVTCCQDAISLILKTQIMKDLNTMGLGRIDYRQKVLQSVLDYSKHANLGATSTIRLWRTINDAHPIPNIFDSKSKELYKKFELVHKTNIKLSEALTSQELMSKFWDDKVFSMRNSNSKIFAQSRFLKEF